MFRITTPNGAIITEKVNYIRVHKNGKTFLLTDAKNAEGVAYHGAPYLYKDGTSVYEFDGADEIRAIQNENASLKEQLINAEEALIELYESMEVRNG